MDKFYILSFCITYNSNEWKQLFTEIEKFMDAHQDILTNKMVLPRWTRGDYVRIIVETDGKNIAQLQDAVQDYWSAFLEENPSKDENQEQANPFYENYPNNSLLYFGGHPVYSLNGMMPIARNLSDKLRGLISFSSDMAIAFGKANSMKKNLNRFFYPALIMYSLAETAPAEAGNIIEKLVETSTPNIDEEKLAIMNNQLKANSKQLAKPFATSLQQLIHADTHVREFCCKFWENNTLEKIEDLSTVLHIFGITKYEELLMFDLISAFQVAEHNLRQQDCA